MVVQPPPGSDLKLTKNSEFIEIVIPPQGIGFGLIALLSAAVANVILWRNFFTFILPNSAIILLFLIISGTFLGAVGIKFILALFWQRRLRIDRQQICYSSHLLGLRWNDSRPAPRQDICQLEIEQIKYRGSQVIVHAGDQKYRLGVKQGLSESEIEWLATELSQWLGLKIQITYSNPK